ncbi:uncharacterized protein BO87DRAFT_155060 [Aspergillus neoniger CBS 115656]|uniref:Uncharacterized protein n=1 Tax=Aspergillus neoniger (strain CBS 115656) TaxID=1448310 RepID=A0A318Y7W3_ASPNB|nr:hypothetical protein BO87DRAFT_155060 [Aspergillus neoniger CBS 115656]PYH30376.1 hypothetical protein BO87DRAFT_155060 [Aspergillus neoniger CBS 115656]
MTGHDLPGWGLYLPSGRSVRLGLLFPTHSRGVQVLFYHHSGLVASSAETCGFCSATGLLVWVWKRLIDFCFLLRFMCFWDIGKKGIYGDAGKTSKS